MEVSDSHHYDHPVEAVFQFFSDPARIQAKFEGIGTRNIEVLECAARDNGHLTKTLREVPANVPSILKKFLGAWNTVVQTEEWRREGPQWICDLTADIKGVPVDISGSMILRPEGKGCVNDVKIIVKCGIPLVGGKLADFVADDTGHAMDAEYEYIKSHLP